MLWNRLLVCHKAICVGWVSRERNPLLLPMRKPKEVGYADANPLYELTEKQQMSQPVAERQSVGQIAVCGLIFLCTAIPVGLLLRVGWRDWTAFCRPLGGHVFHGRNRMVSSRHSGPKGLFIWPARRHGASGSGVGVDLAALISFSLGGQLA